MGHECGDIHNVLVYVLLGFILLHVAAAVWHYFLKRDQVVGACYLESRLRSWTGLHLRPGLVKEPTHA